MANIEVHLKQFHDASVGVNDAATKDRAEAFLQAFVSQPYAQAVALAIITEKHGNAKVPTFPAQTKFRAVNALRKIVLKNWETTPVTSRLSLRSQLFGLAVDTDFAARTEQFVVRQLLQFVAVMYKRGWFDGQGEPSPPHLDLLQRVKALFARAGEQQLRGAQFVGMVIEEFATSHSVAIGLSVDFHKRCANSFKEAALPELFTVALRFLAASQQSNPTPNDHQVSVQMTVETLKIVNATLGWDFEDKLGRFETSHHADGRASSSQHLKAAMVRPGYKWQSLLFNPQIFQVLLKAATPNAAVTSYALKRQHHLARQCLIQMASLDGKMYKLDSAGRPRAPAEQTALKRKMATAALKTFQELSKFCMKPASAQEPATFVEDVTIDTCTVIQRMSLVCAFDEVLCGLPRIFDGAGSLLNTLVQLLQSLLNAACRALASSQFDAEMESWHMEAVDLLMDAWCKWSTCVIERVTNSPSAEAGQLHRQFASFSQRVFKSMCVSRVQVAGKIAAANLREIFEGITRTASPTSAGQHSSAASPEASAVDGNDDDDDDVLTGQPRFSVEDASYVQDQLESIACIGRLSLAPSLSMLVSAVQTKAKAVLTEQEALWRSLPLAPPKSALVQQSEELRWLLLLVGFVIADSCDGELPAIPDVVNGCQVGPGQPDVLSSMVTTLVTLINSVKSSWEQRITRMATAGHVAGHVPTIILPHEPALVWLSHRWSATYLFADPSEYGPTKYNPRRPQLHPSIANACGMQCAHAAQVLDNIVGLLSAGMAVATPVLPALRNLNTLLIERCILHLRALVMRKPIRLRVKRSKCQAWSQLVNIFVAASGSAGTLGLCHHKFQTLEGLPSMFHREIVSAICAAESANYVIALCRLLEAKTKSLVAKMTTLCANGHFHDRSIHSPANVETFATVAGTQRALQQVRGLVVAVEDTASRGGAKVLETTLTLLDPLLKQLWVCCGGRGPPAEDGSLEQRSLVPLLVQTLKILRDFCKVHVPSMPRAGCDKLFEIIAGVMRSIQPRLSQKLNVGECGTFFPIIFAILQSVAAKATLDFSAEEEEVPGQRVPLELQVAMVGLQVIIPNFTTVARTNPTVVETYFSLLSWLLSDHVDVIATTQPEFFSRLLASIVYGLGHHTATTIRNALSCVRAVALVKLEGKPSAAVIARTQPQLYENFLKKIFQVFLMEKFPSGVVSDTASCILHLLAAHQAAYMNVVQDIVANVDSRTSSDLRVAFHQLTSSQGVTPDYKNRLNRRQFAANFEKFLQHARSLVTKA